IQVKQKEEKEFLSWAKANNFNTEVLTDISNSVQAYKPYAKSVVYFSEAFYGSNVARLGAVAYQLKDDLKNKNTSAVNNKINSLKNIRKQLLEDFVYNVELETFAKMSQIIYEDLPKNQLPDVYANIIFPRFGKGDA